MEKVNKIIKKTYFSIAILVIVSILNDCLANNKDSLLFEILLTKKMYKEAGLSEKPIHSVDVSKSQLISISTSNQFCLVGWGGIKTVGKKTWGTVSSFAITPEGLLMAIRNDELCYMDSVGNLIKLYKLPHQNMRITAGKYLMYIYDNNNTKEKKAVYAISHGGKYTKLFEISESINSLAETSNGIYLTCQNSILKYEFKTKSLKPVVFLKNNREIKSLTIDTLNNRIYFSTDSIIYTYKDSSSSVVSDKISGTLKYFGDGLIVFNAENQTLIRITGLENRLNKKLAYTNTNRINSNSSQTINIPSTHTTSINKNKPIMQNEVEKETLTNDNIKKMVKSKLSDELIINVIKTSNVNFDLNVEAMIDLSNQGVSSAVILEMKNAMDKKTGNK